MRVRVSPLMSAFTCPAPLARTPSQPHLTARQTFKDGARVRLISRYEDVSCLAATENSDPRLPKILREIARKSAR
jgi:hypothetical protein